MNRAGAIEDGSRYMPTSAKPADMRLKTNVGIAYGSPEHYVIRDQTLLVDLIIQPTSEDCALLPTLVG